jgi:ABC-2 type transport system ATP-binding protein
VSSVRARGLTKRFGDTEALRGVDLDVPRGTVLGLLGPNGAGKTTIVRILTTLLRPDRGTASVDGIDVLAEPSRVRARIGLTGQYAAVDDRLTGRENLRHVGRLFHLSRHDAKQRSGELLEQFDLEGAGDRVVSGYSGGMRRRLDIAMSLISRPSVLFLDEPTTGLDPRSRLGMWSLIEELVGEGTTMVLTTQYLDEAERLAGEIVVIDHGVVIARGGAESLKADLGADRVQVSVETGTDLDAVVVALAPLQPGGGVARALSDPVASTVTVPVLDPVGVVPAVVRLLDAAGFRVTDVALRRPTLDDVFLQLTGHATGAEEALGSARTR